MNQGEHESDEMVARYSLITVTYNSAEALDRFWGDLSLPPDIEWIVVDNASSDRSATIAANLGARTIILDKNVGFSAANNIGLRAASGQFIGFVNPDVKVGLNSLECLEAAAEADGIGAIVAPQLLNADGSLQPNGRGYPLLTAKIRNRLRGGDTTYLLYARGANPRSVCWVMGAAVFANRETLDRLGAWDPYFFVYYEDKDICLRAWKAGSPVLLVPGVQWTHGWARETAGFRLPAWRRELVSMAKFYRRYPEFLLGRAASRRAHPQIESAVFGGTAS